MPYMAARKAIIDLVGQNEGEDLLAHMVGESGDLASMGQLLGLQKLAEGKISRKDFHLMAGHRPLSENEVSKPRLYETPNWIDQRLEEYRRNPIDYVQLLDEKRKILSSR